MSNFSAADKEFLLSVLKNAPIKRPIEDIAAWVEGRRILPTSTPIPGPWRNSVTPYGVEIMNSMSPNSGIEMVTVEKCRKVGLTTIIENIVSYYMLECPSEILYTTASETLAKDWGDNKIMTVIDTLNGRDKITASVTNAKSRRNPDKTLKKEYIGGKLDIMSSNSKEARRALDKRVLFIDEVDGVEAVTTTGEGKWTEILFGHTISWGKKRKIILFGSPTVEETSLTHEYYLQGDCRVFTVPCPYCGKLIELKLDLDSSAHYGLKAETAAGKIISAYYLCEYCHEPIRNEHKLDMYSDSPRCLKHPEKTIDKYQWQPTRKPIDDTYRSYGLNALYSPIGMLTFTDVVKRRAKAEAGDHVDMRSYTNIDMGKPYKDVGKRPVLKKTLEHRGIYTRGIVPLGALFITMACDVQRGSKDIDEKGIYKNPPRIECEIMATGLNYKTWSVDYITFEEPYREDENHLKDAYSGAWEDLYQWLSDIGGTFYNKEKQPFQLKMIGIDSGDAKGGRAETVYRFCERLSPFAYPLKGFAQLTARSDEKADVPGAASFKKYRIANIGTAGENVIEISTVYYKDVLFSRLNIGASEDSSHPNGYCDFPADYSDEYFIQLTNSEKITGGGYRDIKPNEALDCRVFNLCLSDAWLDNEVKRMRKEAVDSGYDATWAKATINSRTVLENLQARLEN